MRTENEANDQTHSWPCVRLRVCVCLCLLVKRTSTHHTTHLHCMLLATAMCVCVCAQTEAYACQELKGHARPGELSQLVRASWGLFDDQVQEGRHSQFNVPLASSRRGSSSAKKRHAKSGESVWPWAQPHRHILEANRLATCTGAVTIKTRLCGCLADMR